MIGAAVTSRPHAMPDAVLSFDLRPRTPASIGGFDLHAVAEIPLHGITAISGPSGAGKSTLVRLLTGLLPATGHLNFGAQSLIDLPAYQRRVGVVFQDTSLFHHLSVAENLAYGARRAGRGVMTMERRQAIISALDLTPLLARAPRSLSGGEAKRVALGRALCAAPRLLVLDEPLNGLDAARKDHLMPLISDLSRRLHVPVIFITHDTLEIAAIADRVLLMDAGRITGYGDVPLVLRGHWADNGRILIEGQHLSQHGLGAGVPGQDMLLRLGPAPMLVGAQTGASSAPIRIMAHITDIETLAAPGEGTSGRVHMDGLMPGRMGWITVQIGTQTLRIPAQIGRFQIGAQVWVLAQQGVRAESLG